ncbi:hypothetical protein ACT6QG_01895 [Xanthobacter sp. TB0136]|uniref:hypothetical protein n=1 Tax=Xanthobacter sp. TB0136 TaxID=3459177 RepID=UPI00403A4032
MTMNFRGPATAAALFCLGLAGITSAAAQNTPAAQPFGTWFCTPLTQDGLNALSFAFEGMSVNNFTLQEGQEIVTNAPVLNFSASALNGSGKMAALSIEVLGEAKGQPAFTFSTHTQDGALAIGGNQTMKTYVFAPQGTLAQADRICIRVSGVSTWN